MNDRSVCDRVEIFLDCVGVAAFDLLVTFPTSLDSSLDLGTKVAFLSEFFLLDPLTAFVSIISRLESSSPSPSFKEARLDPFFVLLLDKLC